MVWPFVFMLLHQNEQLDYNIYCLCCHCSLFYKLSTPSVIIPTRVWEEWIIPSSSGSWCKLRGYWGGDNAQHTQTLQGEEILCISIYLSTYIWERLKMLFYLNKSLLHRKSLCETHLVFVLKVRVQYASRRVWLQRRVCHTVSDSRIKLANRSPSLTLSCLFQTTMHSRFQWQLQVQLGP